MLFSKSTSVNWLLGAAGKAEIKNRERGYLSKLKLLLQSNAALAVGCYYSRREPEKKKKPYSRKDLQCYIHF